MGFTRRSWGPYGIYSPHLARVLRKNPEDFVAIFIHIGRREGFIEHFDTNHSLPVNPEISPAVMGME